MFFLLAGSPIAEIFRNRKGYFSINVQAVCNEKMIFTDIVARWPGSQHDSTIFDESRLKACFARGDFCNGKLLGDAGYPCNNYILTPLRSPGSEAEQQYNNVHILTRNLIERGFGVVRRRFPALSVGLQISLSLVLDVIVACFLLHNVAIEFSDTVNDFEPNEEEIEPPEILAHVLENVIDRNNVILNFFET